MFEARRPAPTDVAAIARPVAQKQLPNAGMDAVGAKEEFAVFHVTICEPRGHTIRIVFESLQARIYADVRWIDMRRQNVEKVGAVDADDWGAHFSPEFAKRN